MKQFKRLPRGTKFIPQNRRCEDGTINRSIAKYSVVDKDGNGFAQFLIYGVTNLKQARQRVLEYINDPYYQKLHSL